jgi:hypothetical protein
MGSAVETLMGLATADNRFDLPYREILPTQLAAADERFQARRDVIKLLGHRAEEGGVSRVASLEAIVPLLFAHTTYKSYPESWLAEQKWDRMNRWLATVSSHPVTGVDLDGIEGIDDWIARLERAGHYVSCSSGTTGKSAMLNATRQDMDWTGRDSVLACAWGTGVVPAQDRRMFGLAPIASVPRNLLIREALADAFGEPGAQPFIYPVPPITIGSITGMVALRKAMADGTARPGDVAAFETLSAERQRAVDAAVGLSAEALVEARRSKLYISGMWATLYKVAEAVRAMGYSGEDFHPENTIYVGGGLKGAVLPDDYREYVYETLNLSPRRVFQMYGMQEINSAMPRCAAGRYHVPPWLICLPLDQEGETLIPARGDEQVEGRAAFFDLSLDGRWGGVISGDRIKVGFGRCACGHQGPAIADDITRYADLPGGDKISCAGTIDAYVRGVA